MVTGRYGTLGRVYFIREDFWPHNTTLWVKDFHGNDQRFVYYLLGALKLADQSAVSAVPGVNRNDLHRLSVSIPTLPIQRRIAEILGRLDDKIEVNRRINRTLEAMAQALYRHWFVEFGPFRDGEFVESELGAIPKGWEVAQLENVADVIMGASPAGDTYNDRGTGTPLINGPVEFGGYFAVKTKWTSAPTRLCREHDLILCVRGSTTGRRVIADDIYCLGRGVCAIRAKHSCQSFINRLVDDRLDNMLTHATGSVYPSLSSDSIRQLRVLKPPKKILDRFCRLVDPMDEQVQTNVKANAKLAKTLDYLLPKLLTGEIRLDLAEDLVGKSALTA